MNFKYCPSFAFAEHSVVAMQPDGSWAGVDSDGVPVTYTAEQMAGAVCIAADPNGDGLYAIVDPFNPEGSRFIADRDTGKVHIEGAERPMQLEDFEKHAVRIDGDGRVICSFLQPLHEQHSLCEGRSAGDLHRRDIAAAASRARSSEAVGSKVDAGLYDIVASGLDDGLDFMEVMRRVTARCGRPVHETAGLAERLPGQWAEIREFQQYMIAPIRALFGRYMESKLGDFPIERVSRLHVQQGFPLSLHLEDMADLVSEDPPFEGGNILPGYKTSPVAHFRGEGFEAIVFSDLAGTYAYAWPTLPRPEETARHAAPGA